MNKPKCVMCGSDADHIISWPASIPQLHEVCNKCSKEVWNKISSRSSGTDALNGFTIYPLQITRNNKE